MCFFSYSVNSSYKCYFHLFLFSKSSNLDSSSGLM